MKRERFWTKSYGQVIKDVDPKLFETSTIDLYRETIKKNAKVPAYIFMGVPFTFCRGSTGLSNQFANMLIKNGLKKGDVVGINLPNIPAFPIAWLGTLKAGCVCHRRIPPALAGRDGASAARFRGQGPGDAGRAVRLPGRQHRAQAPEPQGHRRRQRRRLPPKIKQFLAKKLKKVPTGPGHAACGQDRIHRDGRPQEGRVCRHGDPDVKVGPDDTALLMYTGGTTGVPKGAILTHRNNVAEILVSTQYMQWYKFQENALSAFPMFHIAGMAFNEISFYNGWTQIMLPDPRNTEFICDMLKKYKPFLIANVPSLYHMLMANPRFKTLDHSNLQQCVSAAAPFPVESQKELESIIGKNKLIELYGMTETTAICVMNPLKGERKLGTIGPAASQYRYQARGARHR